MALHEVSHLFLEGGSALTEQGAIPVDKIDDLYDISACLDPDNIDLRNSQDVLSALNNAFHFYKEEQIEKVG